MLFAQKIIRETNEGLVYLIPEQGDDALDFYHLILVPSHKSTEFESAIRSSEVSLNDYGRIVHFGSGTPTQERIEEVLLEKGLKTA